MRAYDAAMDRYGDALARVHICASDRHRAHPSGVLCHGCARHEHLVDRAWLDALHTVSATWVPGTPDRTRVLAQVAL